jgi:uncharacterized protein
VSYTDVSRGSAALPGAGIDREAVGEQRLRHLTEISVVSAVAAICGVGYLLGGTVTIPFLIVVGFALAVVDTAFGMGYGTIATPVLLVAGFGTISTVAAVLVSQAVAAGFGTALHVRYRNIDLANVKGRDAKLSTAIIAFGILGVVAAVFVAVSLPSLYVKTYIGILVVSTGLFLLTRPRVRFSWPKVYAISAANGFDKAISGGGFGPAALGGLLALGHKLRNSVAIAVFTVMIINLVGVVLYFLLDAVNPSGLFLMATLSVGAMLGALLGPGITGRLHSRGHLNGLALFILAVGAVALVTTFVKV